MLSVQPGGLLGGDEELGTVGVLTYEKIPMFKENMYSMSLSSVYRQFNKYDTGTVLNGYEQTSFSCENMRGWELQICNDGKNILRNREF